MKPVLLGLSNDLLSWDSRMTSFLVAWIAHLELGDEPISSLRHRYFTKIDPVRFGEEGGMTMKWTDCCVVVDTEWDKQYDSILLASENRRDGERGFVASIKPAPALDLPDSVVPPLPITWDCFLKFATRLLDEFIQNINSEFYRYQQLKVQGCRLWIPRYQKFGGDDLSELHDVYVAKSILESERGYEYEKPFSEQMENIYDLTNREA